MKCAAACRAHFQRCEAAFKRKCVGPSRQTQAERLAKVMPCRKPHVQGQGHFEYNTIVLCAVATMFESEGCQTKRCVMSPERTKLQSSQAWRREEARFRRDYNDKLFNGLVVFALADILLFRFVIRISLAETVGWVGFVFLQVLRRLCVHMIQQFGMSTVAHHQRFVKFSACRVKRRACNS